MTKKKPSSQIIDIYRSNKERLNAEIQKSDRSRATMNTIQAYRHIVTSLERTYELS